MQLSKAQRATLREKFRGRCAYCGIILPDKWHADHLEPIQRITKLVRVDLPHQSHKFVQTGECRKPENDHIDNYYPSCRPCNIDKTCLPLEDWRQALERRPQVLRDNYSAYRHAERFGLVVQAKTKVVFYFEKLEASKSRDGCTDCMEVNGLNVCTMNCGPVAPAK